VVTQCSVINDVFVLIRFVHRVVLTQTCVKDVENAIFFYGKSITLPNYMFKTHVRCYIY